VGVVELKVELSVFGTCYYLVVFVEFWYKYLNPNKLLVGMGVLARDC